MQAVYAVSEPTSNALWGRGAGCLSGAGTYLRGTVLQGCRLFKRCLNHTPGHCVAGCRLFKRCPNLHAGQSVAGVQAVKAVLEPFSRALWGRGAGCLSDVGTYLPGPVLQGCRLFKRFQNLPAGYCVQGCRLFKRCRNLPARHCVAGVQAVSTVSDYISWALCCRDAGCLSSVETYLSSNVLQGCRLFKRCQHLPAW